MDMNTQPPKERKSAILALNVSIEIMDAAQRISSIAPAKGIFASLSNLLVLIRDFMINEVDYVDLGLACADVCKALDRGLKGKRTEELNQSVLGAIEQLTTTVSEIQRKVAKRGKRSMVAQLLHTNHDKEMIASWKGDLKRILQVFETELAIDTQVTLSDDASNSHTLGRESESSPAVSDLQNHGLNTPAASSSAHSNASRNRKDTDGQGPATHASAPGEKPHPPPGNALATVSDNHLDVAKSRATGSEVHCDVNDTRAVDSDVHRETLNGEGASGQN